MLLNTTDRQNVLVKRALRACPLECGKHLTRLLFPCRRYINNANSGTRDILAKILYIVDKWSNFLSPSCQLLIVMLWPFIPLHLVTIGVLEFVVVIDVYAQPTREKIK